MTSQALRSSAVVAVIACVAGAACGREEPAATTPVQLVAGPSATPSGLGAAAGPRLPAAGTGGDVSGVIAFPPRNEPFAFREELEAQVPRRAAAFRLVHLRRSRRRHRLDAGVPARTASTSATTRRPCRRCSSRSTAAASRRGAGTRHRAGPWRFRRATSPTPSGRNSRPSTGTGCGAAPRLRMSTSRGRSCGRRSTCGIA